MVCRSAGPYIHTSRQEVAATRGPLLAKIYQKQKELAVNGENPVKMYSLEIKPVSSFLVERKQKSAGGKYEGKSHYVFENTCRKNVRFEPCQDVVEK
jgi:hypothetical protein